MVIFTINNIQPFAYKFHKVPRHFCDVTYGRKALAHAASAVVSKEPTRKLNYYCSQVRTVYIASRTALH